MKSPLPSSKEVKETEIPPNTRQKTLQTIDNFLRMTEKSLGFANCIPLLLVVTKKFMLEVLNWWGVFSSHPRIYVEKLPWCWVQKYKRLLMYSNAASGWFPHRLTAKDFWVPLFRNWGIFNPHTAQRQKIMQKVWEVFRTFHLQHQTHFIFCSFIHN